MKTIQNTLIVLSLLALSSCSLFQKSKVDIPSSETITDRRWKLIELDGKPVADSINGKEPFLLLLATEGRYTGSGGCNGIGGTFALAGKGRITFSQGMSTKMACEDMEVENGLTKVLVAADNYSLKGDSLSLNKARMAPLARFKALQ